MAAPGIFSPPFEVPPQSRRKSSLIQMKPLSNLTSLIPKSNDNHASSAQNPNSVLTDQCSIPNPPTPSPGDWVGDRNRIGFSGKHTMLKTRSKTKADSAAVVTVVPNVIEDVCVPLTGFEMIVKGKPIVLCIPKPNSTGAIMDGKGKSVVVGSSLVDLSKKYEADEVATPINFGSQLRTKSNRIEVDGVEDALRSKLSTDPLPNNKKRNCLSKGSSKEYVMPEDSINQQRAYFKKIDEYELEVEEVE